MPTMNPLRVLVYVPLAGVIMGTFVFLAFDPTQHSDSRATESLPALRGPAGAEDCGDRIFCPPMKTDVLKMIAPYVKNDSATFPVVYRGKYNALCGSVNYTDKWGHPKYERFVAMSHGDVEFNGMTMFGQYYRENCER
ncbi:hypothetical protein [Cupriavidus sp. 8B]